MHVVDFTTFYPPHVGGVEAFAAALHREWLSRSGWKVTVVTSDQGGPLPAEDTGRLRIETYPAWEPVSGFGMPRRSPLALALAQVTAPVDVVLSHTRFYPASWLAGRFARRMGARWVHIEHGGSAVQSGSSVVRGVAHTYDRLLGVPVLRGADRVISVSQGSADFVHALSGVTATVARRGITLPVAAWSAPAQPRALFVGRLVRAKGIRETVDALAGTGLPLDVVGEGPDRTEFEQHARSSGVQATFHGMVDSAEVESRMRAASLLIHPSHTEGLPTVVLEAAALGMPIIASDVGGTREIVSGTGDGWLVAPRDIAPLAQAVRAAMSDPVGAAERGEQARVGVNARFSWDHVIEAISDGVPHRA